MFFNVFIPDGIPPWVLKVLNLLLWSSCLSSLTVSNQIQILNTLAKIQCVSMAEDMLLDLKSSSSHKQSS